MKTASAIILPLLAVWLTGCIGVVPVPSSGQTYGQVITREATKFIVPGRTTRDAVIAELGDQFRDSPRLPVLAYTWEKPGCGLMWWVVLVGPYGGGAGGGHSEASDWRALFVKFDAHGRVSATKFASLSSRRSLDEQLEDWALGKTHRLANLGGNFFDQDSGVPQFVEYMKQTGQVCGVP